MKINQMLPLLGLSLLIATSSVSAQNSTQASKCCKCSDTPDVISLPPTIFSGVRGPFHVQGIAVDLKQGYIYFSFTTELLKMDLQGNLIGSVKGLTGHLGCLTMKTDGFTDPSNIKTMLSAGKSSKSSTVTNKLIIPTLFISLFSTWIKSPVPIWMPKRIA